MIRYKYFILCIMYFVAHPHHVYSQAETLRNPSVHTFYVSTVGNDQWTGSIPVPNSRGDNGPFATMRRARDVIRTFKQSSINSQFTVLVRGGIYRLNETLTLGPEDSGTESSPFTIKAYDNEYPVLTCARPVTGFVPYKDGIHKAALKGTTMALSNIRQLFADGKRQTIARIPNYDPSDPIGKGFMYVEKSVGIGEGSKIAFKYSEGAVRDWAKPNDAEIFIYPGPNYWNNIIPIAGIDRDQRIITLAGNASYPIISGNRYFLQNLLEELDSPGEWYLDQSEKTLYFWPLNEASLSSVSVPILKSIIEIKARNLGSKYKKLEPAYIRIEGFTFEGCEGDAIVVDGANKIIIAKNTIYNSGKAGINVQGGIDNVILGNDIYEVGADGIRLSGGDLRTHKPGGNRVENNYIRNTGVFNKLGMGINCTGVGNIISHNLVHSVPRAGIYLGGNDNIVEYNHIHHVNQETEDSGVIYIGTRDWTQRGNIIRFNYFHDSGGYGRIRKTVEWQRPFFTYGIYLDDWTSGTVVYGNIVANAARGGIFIHAGRDNTIENNIIIEGGSGGQMIYSAWPLSNSFVKKTLPAMYAKIKEYDPQRYPKLLTIKDIASGAKMSGNSFVRNIIYYTNKNSELFRINNEIDYTTTISDFNIIYHKGFPLLIQYMKVAPNLQWQKWKDFGFDRNSIIADPLFVDAAKSNFNLLADSPALKIGFKPIPFAKIGPYQDTLRASWPIKD